jgi:hypothetical protein
MLLVESGAVAAELSSHITHVAVDEVLVRPTDQERWASAPS